jgi:hypothetical protein
MASWDHAPNTCAATPKGAVPLRVLDLFSGLGAYSLGLVRVVHGAPDRVERVHALGNLNPPIIPEIIGRAILEAEAA